MAPIRAQAKFSSDGMVMVRVAGPQPVQYGPERRGDAMRKLGTMAAQLGSAIQLDTLMPDGSVEQALFRTDGSVLRRPAPQGPAQAHPSQHNAPAQSPAPTAQHPAPAQNTGFPSHSPAERPPRVAAGQREQLRPAPSKPPLQRTRPEKPASWDPTEATNPEAVADKVVTLKESAAWVFPHLSRQMWVGIIIGAVVLIAGIVIATVLGLSQAGGSANEAPAQNAPADSGQVFHFEDPTTE